MVTLMSRPRSGDKACLRHELDLGQVERCSMTSANPACIEDWDECTFIPDGDGVTCAALR
jgi:hypothetical protein